MPKIQIQFHAAPEETLTLAARWARKYDLVLVVEQLFPKYRANLASNDEVRAAADELDRVDRVALCAGTPDLGAGTAHEFVTRNPSCLFLSIGPLDDEGLRESALGGATDDPHTWRTWRRLVRRAESEMHKGASVGNPGSGSVDPLPNHLHTPGAHALAEAGVRMLAAAGWNEFEFDDRSADGPSRAGPGLTP